MGACSGNGDDHCCYFGEVCEHLEENTVEGRRWTCKLKRIYGTWEAVYMSSEWPGVAEKAKAVGLREDFKCGDWPYPSEECGACGING